jgi:hypothetical protein
MRERWPAFKAAATFTSKVVVEGADLGESYSSDEDDLPLFSGFNPPLFTGDWKTLCS